MSPEELREHLWKLPPDERCAMLILSCVELDQNALGGVLNVVGVASLMGQRLAPHQRSVLAGNMRLAAHRLEQDRFPRQTFEANGASAPRYYLVEAGSRIFLLLVGAPPARVGCLRVWHGGPRGNSSSVLAKSGA